MTTPTPDVFSLDRLPPIPEGSTPPELFTSPYAKEANEYVRLRDESRRARAELAALVAQRDQAAASDRRALTDAMAAGKKDPGDPATTRLVADVTAGRRRLDGLARATRRAFNALLAALDADADGWADTLRDAAGDGIENAVEELRARIKATESARNALAWLRKATETEHPLGGTRKRTGLPGRSGATKTIHITGDCRHDNLLDAIRDAYAPKEEA